MNNLANYNHMQYSSGIQKMLCLPIIVACDERSITYSTLVNEVNIKYPKSHYNLKSFYQVLNGTNQYAYKYCYYTKFYEFLNIPLPITPSYLVECEKRFIIIRGKLKLQAVERKELTRLRKLWVEHNPTNRFGEKRKKIKPGVDVVKYFADLSLLTGLKY